MSPDALDIANALEDMAAGLRLDPSGGYDHLCWLCAGTSVATGATTYGLGLTQREAMADTWVGISLGTLLDAVIDGKPRSSDPTTAGGSSCTRPARGSAPLPFTQRRRRALRTSPAVRHPVDRGGSYVSIRR